MFCTYKIIEHINPIRDSMCHKGWRMLAESRALMAMVAMFLHWAESSLTTTRESGSKKCSLCCVSMVCAVGRWEGGSQPSVVISGTNFHSFICHERGPAQDLHLKSLKTPMFGFCLLRPLHVFTPMRMKFCPFSKNSTFLLLSFSYFFSQIWIHLGGGLKDVRQRL